MPSVNGNDDEFDSIYTDDPLLDAALEESLAQVEASYSASQTSKAHNAFRPDQLNPNTKKGSFVPPFKKQRTEAPFIKARPRHGRFLREPEADEVIVHDLRNDDFMDQEDESWWASSKDLDQVEQDAIRMSQQFTQRQPSVPPAANGSSYLRRQRSPSPPAESAAIASEDGEIRELKKELARLRELERMHEELTSKLKQEAYSKAGEVSVVRQNLTKVNQENAKLREREIAREQEHKAALDRLQLENQRQLERLETETTFRRVEQDTSRRIWPSSVMRVAPIGLRDTDRRRESQVRAGLTTPTKSRKFDSRGSGSGSRSRYTAEGRDEPDTPTRSATKAKQLFPPSVTKGKTFKGFQNSFADFGAVSEKAQRRQQHSKSPAYDDAAENFNDDVTMAEVEELDPVVRPGSPVSEPVSSTRQREKQYLFAMSEMLRRRTMVVSHVLCHASMSPSAPISYPSNIFNPSGAPPDAAEVSAETTLHRLISTPLVTGCPDLVVYRHKKAVATLLGCLSQASVYEAEDKWSAEVLLLEEDWKAEDVDMSKSTVSMSSCIARCLLTMSGVALRTCQTNLVVDALRLIRSLTSNVAGFATILQHAWDDREIQAIKNDELAYRLEASIDAETADGLATPTHLIEILAQSTGDCRPYRDYDVVEAGAGDALGMDAWDMGFDAREDLFESVVQLLETITSLPLHPTLGLRALELLHRPGILHQMLDKERSATTICKTVRMLASSQMDAPFVHGCLAAKPAITSGSSGNGQRRNAGGINGVRMKAKFPVLEILVKHLVDRRSDLPECEWHPLHCVILVFLMQAALRSADTLAVLADSAALLAALVRCLSLDADFLWNESRPSFMMPTHLPRYKTNGASESALDATGADVLQATERLVTDIRLLNLLYNHPPPMPTNGDRHTIMDDGKYERVGPVSLTKKLDEPETYSMLNGIRQSFVVALSRVAFCPEPEWIGSERKFLLSLSIPGEDQTAKELAAGVDKRIKDLARTSQLMETIADVAGDLIDIVLNPDEIDSIYDLLAEESASDNDEEYLEDMQEDRDVDVRQKRQDVQAEGQQVSDTESEPDDYAIIAARKKAMGGPDGQHSDRVPSSVSPQKSVGRLNSASPDKRALASRPASRGPISRTTSKPRQNFVVIDDSD